MSTPREEMLGAIRRALRDRGTHPPGSETEGGGSAPKAAEPRGLEMAGQVPLDLLQSRIADYQATVLRCSSSALPQCLSERLRSRGVRRLVVPSDLPETWIPDGFFAGTELLRDGDPNFLSTEDLASMDAVVTGCALAIAETGTLVLDGSRGQGRRAISLLPDYHLCVVMKAQVVGTVAEGISHLQGTQGAQRAQGAAPGPLTLISGPSATSDIELIRVEGVHGPRTLDVILVEDQ